MEMTILRKKHKVFKILIASGVIISLLITGCGKKKSISYGDKDGIATGTIDLTGNDPKISIDNIKAPVGSDIDYTSELNVLAGDLDDYEVEVNATNVKNDKPGTYNVEYKVKSSGQTYTKGVKVTIEGSEKEAVVQQDSQQQELGQSQNIGQPQNAEQPQNIEQPQVNTPTQNAQSNPQPQSPQPQNSQQQNTNQSNTQQSTERVFVPGDKQITVAYKTLDNAVIELLSGDIVTIKCSTSKYIVSTRTDETTVERNGHHYRVSKLVIVFNTGEERTLETIEKKID